MSALKWFSSFPLDGTHQERFGNSLYSVAIVTFSVTEDSVLGSNLFNVVADSLHRCTQLPYVGYADDFTFVYEVTINSQDLKQAETDTVCNSSIEFSLPLLLEIYLVLHCGRTKSSIYIPYMEIS